MKEVREGETLTFSLAVVDGDGSGIIFSASNLPEGASFDQEGGVFTWTPGYDQAGVYDGVRFEVSDGVFMDCEAGSIDSYTTVSAIADIYPVADFTGTPLTGSEPITVSFTDTSTSYDGIYLAGNSEKNQLKVELCRI